MRKYFFAILATILICVTISQLSLAQVPPTEKPASPPVRAEARKITITGTIGQSPTGYVIQGQKPPEIFTIQNPNPKVLDNLVQSGQTVTLEARVILGDNVLIEKLDGKQYQGR